jgi:hypothetical protein
VRVAFSLVIAMLALPASGRAPVMPFCVETESASSPFGTVRSPRILGSL